MHVCARQCSDMCVFACIKSYIGTGRHIKYTQGDSDPQFAANKRCYVYIHRSKIQRETHKDPQSHIHTRSILYTYIHTHTHTHTHIYIYILA